MKAWLRRAAAPALDRLRDAIADALRVVKPGECQNYFTACGYGGE